MQTTAKIFVAGSRTLIGSALVRQLRTQSFENLGDKEPVLTDAGSVDEFFARERPEFVFLVAGKSGGIHANQTYPATLMLDNLLIETNVISSAHRHGVKKLLYLASSCCYPKHTPQPMKEDALLTGVLEPTSEPYAIAKIAGIKLCQAYRRQYGVKFIAGIPADVFGPGDIHDLDDLHVVPALLLRMHDAKAAGRDHVTLWGSGAPQREFTFADDLADACIVVMREYDGEEPINIGSGEPVSIRALAELIREVVGFQGKVLWDPTRPDGAPIKLLDSSRLRALGWRPSTTLQEGLRATYRNLLASQQQKENK